MRKSIEFTENQLEEKVNNAENKLTDIEHRIEEIYDYKIDPDNVVQKLIDLEDRSKRNNMRVNGIQGKHGKIKEKLQQVFQEKLSIECRVEIEQPH